MALYVGGTLTITDTRNLIVKEMSNVMWGGYKGASLSGSTAEHYVGLSELVKGYTLSGYKSSACGNDVNKSLYKTDTTTHVSNAMCQGNYNCGGSAPLKGGMSWAACGCQTTSTATRFFTYSTETVSTGPTKTSRSNNGTFDDEGLWMSYTFGGGSTTHETYNWKADTFSTAPASPHSTACDVSWQTHDMGYSYANNASSTIYYYKWITNAWATGTSSGGATATSGGVCPAWSCTRMGSGLSSTFSDAGKGYTSQHGAPGALWVLNATSPGTISCVNAGGWPGRLAQVSGYTSEHPPLNGNRSSRASGGYNGVQHTYGAKINNFTDIRTDVPSLDATSDVSGVSSGVGVCSAV